jgi:hypothetical protein
VESTLALTQLERVTITGATGSNRSAVTKLSLKLPQSEQKILTQQVW